jgi:DivIVA domain-containing protein
MDGTPLTATEVRNVVFDKAPIGKRGYHERQVDEFLDRIEGTLAGTDALSAAEVRTVLFENAPLIKRGYNEQQVDSFLDLVVNTLDRLEKAGSGRSMPRRAEHPAGRAPVPVAPPAPTEETNPLPFMQPPSLPTPSAPRLQPVPPGEPLAMPLPPAPPGAHGYRPRDVHRLAGLLATATSQQNDGALAELMSARLNWTHGPGQGYRTDVVDALLAAWVEELRRRAL